MEKAFIGKGAEVFQQLYYGHPEDTIHFRAFRPIRLEAVLRRDAKRSSHGTCRPLREFEAIRNARHVLGDRFVACRSFNAALDELLL